MKPVLFITTWFVTGGLGGYCYLLSAENTALAAQLGNFNQLQNQYQQQITLNAQQRQTFEGQIAQLQNNLLGAQSQMANLSAALQAAREMIDPPLQPESPATSPDSSPQ